MDKIVDRFRKACKTFREVHKEAVSLHQTYRLSLDKVLVKKKGTIEQVKRTLLLRIERQREMGREGAKVKRKVFKQLQSFNF